MTRLEEVRQKWLNGKSVESDAAWMIDRIDSLEATLREVKQIITDCRDAIRALEQAK